MQQLTIFAVSDFHPAETRPKDENGVVARLPIPCQAAPGRGKQASYQTHSSNRGAYRQILAGAHVGTLFGWLGSLEGASVACPLRREALDGGRRQGYPTRMSTGSRRTRKDAVDFLTQGGEEIVKTIHFYRFMTAVDVTRLLYSPSSLPYVRRLLTALAGGADKLPNQYLYRFSLPRTKPGTPVKVFTLGMRGREFLQEERGLPDPWCFRPEKVKHLSFGHLMHQLTLTRFLVAARAWCAGEPDFRIERTRISYELGVTPPRVRLGTDQKAKLLPVVPDAWLLFEELRGGAHTRWLPVLIEIDRGTEYQQKFKQHIRGRIEFIVSGAYRKLFQTEAVRIAYATTGETPEYRETRRATMCAWTREVLAEQDLEAWASVFHFASVVYEDLYDTPLFREPVWSRPDQSEPVPLFAP